MGDDVNIYYEARRATIAPAAELDEESSAKLLRVINSKHARTKLSADQVYIFPGVLSTQAIDYYGTRMAPSSIKNYQRDVRNGIALMNSHRTGGWSSAELPVGRIFDGEIMGELIKPKRSTVPFDDQMGAELHTWNYMMRGVRVTDVSNDDLIAAIEGGTIKDMSITFSTHPDGQLICSVCGLDYLNRNIKPEDPRCTHIAFASYEGQRAYVWVENGGALEGSLVYAGATPGAEIRSHPMVRKAQEQANALPSEAVGWLEDHYQCRLLDASVHPVSKPTRKEDKPMAFDRTTVAKALETHAPGKLEEVRALEDDQAFVNAAATTLTARITEMSIEIVGLQADADLGRRYRDDLVDTAVKARVRAQGSEFDADKYRAALNKSADLDFIKGEAKTWEGRAAEVLRGGPGQHRQKSSDEVKAPVSAYQ